MGIFKSFATSGFGDFSTGALRGIAEQGVADAKKKCNICRGCFDKRK